MEIVTKLCDPDFVRQAKAADFFSRAWEALREAGGGEATASAVIMAPANT